MVLTLVIPIRALYGLEDFITMRHLENMAKVMLVTGLIVAYGYMMEAFIAWYGAEPVRDVHDVEPDHRAVLVDLLRCSSCATSSRRRRSGSSGCGPACRRCS